MPIAGNRSLVGGGGTGARGIKFTPDANTALWLPGQDDAYSGTIRDKSGNNNNGTITGATWTREPSGLWSLYFNGVNQVVDCGATGGLNIANGFSIVTWFKADNVTGNKQLIAKTKATDSGEFSLLLIGDDIYLYLLRDIDSTYHGHKSVDIVLANTWYQVITTWAGGNISVAPLIYLNGVSKTVADGGSAGVDGATANSTATVRLGLKYSDGDDYAGYMALPRIITRVLTTGEAANIYNQERYLSGV